MRNGDSRWDLGTGFPALSLLAIYSIVLFRFRGNFELNRDDGLWILRALAIIKKREFLSTGVMSSLDIPNSPLGAYFHALWYLAWPSIYSIRAGILLTIILTHALLIGLSKDLRLPRVGIFSSLLFFFNPAFFLIYNQKFWQVVYLPLYSTAAIALAIRYVNKPSTWSLVASCVAIILCANFNFSAVLLWPLCLVLPLLTRDASRFRRIQNLAVVLPPVIFSGSLMFGPQRDPLTGVQGFFDTLSALNPFTADHVGSPMSFFGRPLGPTFAWVDPLSILFLAAWAFCLSRWKKTAVEQKLLFLWTWIPFWLMAASAAVLKKFPHHWFVFQFPAPFVLIAAVAAQQGTRFRVARFFLGAVVAVQVVISIYFAGFIGATGGIKWHFSTFSEKFDVLNWIYRESPDPQIFLALNPGDPWNDYGTTGWAAADFEVSGGKTELTSAAKKDIFFITESRGATDDARCEAALVDSVISTKAFQSVKVYRLDRWPVYPGKDISQTTSRRFLIGN